MNARDDIDGILVQLPLPAHINARRVMAAVDPAKDVDGLHALNAGRLLHGADALVPCTPFGCLKLIKSTVSDLTGCHAVVIGSSNIVGKPMAALLLEERATVTQTHIHTRDTASICRGADILVSAVGKPGLVRGDWIKPRAIVIDVGTTRVARPDGGYDVRGDVAFDEAVQVAGAITPVPRGVGPMTIACLIENTVKAAKARSREAALTGCGCHRVVRQGATLSGLRVEQNPASMNLTLRIALAEWDFVKAARGAFCVKASLNNRFSAEGCVCPGLGGNNEGSRRARRVL